MKTLIPPLKIQGIKSKLVAHIKSHISWDYQGMYFEPFMGSGVVGFNIAPKRAIFSDNNPHIIHFYQAIQQGIINRDSIREYLYKIEARREMIAEMPDNVIPMNFHLYEIRIGDDSLEMNIDYIWNILAISYSGNKKVMKQFQKISKDLYIFYGVSEDDIKKKTERYLSLVTALSS